MNEIRYTPVAIVLHWLMAALLIFLFALGLYMSDLPASPERIQLFTWHKWAGVTAFLLVLARIIWRSTHRPPVLLVNTTPLLARAAQFGHLSLYLLMIIVPLSGWLMSSAKGYPTVYFGVITLPDLVVKDKVLGETLKELHEILNNLFMIIVAGHLIAALKHQFVDKDNLLVRMKFGSSNSDAR